jgi:SSS family solute:Na+ symporter
MRGFGRRDGLVDGCNANRTTNGVKASKERLSVTEGEDVESAHCCTEEGNHMNGQLSLVDILLVVAYLGVTAYLGWLGWRRTRTAADYLLAGRRTHPFIMALSYGATFISTSAIVGFGGVAGQLGMGILWLVFLNIFAGIFIAFIFLGGPTRRMGHHLDAHTFPELISRRFQSRFIQVFSGLMIFLFMPLYAAAVIIGGCKFFITAFGLGPEHFNTALLLFSCIVAMYVVFGGLKGILYTDALQGAIMILGMTFLLVFTYQHLGGVVEAHKSLSDLDGLVPANLASGGHRGWTSFPEFGFGHARYNMWWSIVTAVILGVGIGVLAQPALVVRFMTVKSKRELNRAVPLGGLFILLIPGTAYVVGALSNAWFVKSGPLFEGTVVRVVDEAKGHAIIKPLRVQDAGGQWGPAGMDNSPGIPVVAAEGEKAAPGQLVTGRSIAQVYANGDREQIIPVFITRALPPWFGMVFLLTLLSAAMSTLSTQFHSLGSAIGRDVYEQLGGQQRKNRTVHVVRLGAIIGIMIAVGISYYGKSLDWLIARGTAIFFGLCSATFLPTLIGGLFFRRMTKPAAIASMLTGAGVSAFWLLLVKAKEAGGLQIVRYITGGKDSILWNYPNWPEVDPVVVALPASLLVAVVVSMFTKPPAKEHLDKCFAGEGRTETEPMVIST